MPAENANAAQYGRGGEPNHITDHTAAKSDEYRTSIRTLSQNSIVNRRECVETLVLLTVGYVNIARRISDHVGYRGAHLVAVERIDGRVSDQKHLADWRGPIELFDTHAYIAERTRADVHIVGPVAQFQTDSSCGNAHSGTPSSCLSRGSIMLSTRCID